MLTIPNQSRELEALTVRELLKFAGELDIRGRSKMKKDDLVREIVRARSENADSRASDSSSVVDIAELVEKRALEALEELPEILILDEALDDSQLPDNDQSSSSSEEEIAMASQSEPPNPVSGPSEITLLAVHSRRLFAYWQCNLAAVSRARQDLKDPDAAITLRLSDVTLIEFDNERVLSSVDIAVHSPDGNYYFNDVLPGHAFRCRLGLKSATDGFHELARSETVESPPERVSVLEFASMEEVSGAGEGPWRPRAAQPVSPTPDRKQEAPREKNVPVADAAVQVDHDLSPASAEPAAQEGSPAPREVTPLAAAAAVVATDGPVLESEVRPRFNFIPSELAPQASSLDLVEGGQGSSDALAMPSSRLGNESSLGLIPLVERVPEPDLSHDVTAHPDQPGLQLELHAELIVYGRASPEIQVVIDGVRVPVREDGRFDVRFALNHVPIDRP